MVMEKVKNKMAKHQYNFDVDEDMTKANGADALSSLMTDDVDTGKTKRKYTRKAKQEVQTLQIKGEQVALVTSGLLAALEGITKMPFKDVDKDVKQSFDDSLAQCASIYGGEYVAKYLPLIQLGLCASLVVSTTYQKHLETKKKAQPNEEAA